MSKVKYYKVKEVNFKEMRANTGLSLRQLSKLCGVGFLHLHLFEKGTQVITENTWNKIKKHL